VVVGYRGQAEQQNFAAALAPDGQERWSRVWGTDELDEASAVAVSSDGTIWVGGHRWTSQVAWVRALED
jgi:hypothetical protein